MSRNRNYAKRGISYIKRNGLSKSITKAFERMERDRLEKNYRPVFADEETLAAQRAHKFAHPYKFSILVPVYETDPALFRKMLDSVGEQTYGNWELILADASEDESRRNIVREFMEEYHLPCMDEFGSIFEKVRYVRVNVNKGISGNTNMALDQARGDYIALLDHDDVLENTALFDIMSAIDAAEQNSRADESIKRIMAVYTDEDKISEDGKEYFDLHTKPDFDPYLLCTNNYICHFFVADANLAKSVGGFRPEYDGAQDHDFILRCTEDVRRDQILHVAKVLYHWRSTEGSTSENPDAKLYAYQAGRKAVSDHLVRTGIGAKVTDSEHLGFFNIEYERLHRSVESITYEQYKASMGGSRPTDEGDFVMILASNLSPLNRDYIADMMSVMHITDVGAVTGKVIGRNGKVESPVRYAGVKKKYSGYMHRANLHQLLDAFAPDCVLVRREAVSQWYPKIRLKPEYDVYYLPDAAFKRRGL